MNQPNLGQSVPDFLTWRTQLYHALGSRRSSVMDLLDSLSSNFSASTVAELSLNPLFRRDYNSLYKGIQDFLPPPDHPDYQQAVDSLFSVVSATVPAPEERPFYLFGVDVTPCPRPYSATLADKTYIYQPNPIKGNKPINIGHAYSVVAALPERGETGNTPWTYSQRGFLGEQVQSENLVTLARVRSNRVFYRPFIPPDSQLKSPGHPRWYGDKFDLKDATTWGEPDEVIYSTFTTTHGTGTSSQNLRLEPIINEGNQRLSDAQASVSVTPSCRE